MAVISEERFNQDIFEANGFDLYSCDEYLTDGSMILIKGVLRLKIAQY